MQAEEPQADYNGNPQIEDGYIRIANELLDAILRFPFSKRELLIVFAVIRKTYGYNKKMDDLSLTQLENMTGINKAHLSVSINDLVVMKVLLKEQGQYAQRIGLNKKYPEWRGLPKQQPRYQNSNRGVTKTATEGLPKQQPQKTTPKDNTKRHICANDFAQFWQAYPKKKSKGTAEKAWAKINPDEQLTLRIIAAVGQAKTSDDWQKQDGQFIPYPATWLNAKGWEDELPVEDWRKDIL